MADLPYARTTLDDQAGAFGASTGMPVVLGCVEKNPDTKPRVFGSAKSFLAMHGYSASAELVAALCEEDHVSVLFVGLPSASAGSIRMQDDSRVSGTCLVTATPGANGVLAEVDAVVTVVAGGTVGQTGIVLGISTDSGRTSSNVRLGALTSYSIPYIGVTLTLGAGTLVAGDVFVFRTNAPAFDAAGVAAARLALAAQPKVSRSWVFADEVATVALAQSVRDAANSYATSNDRYVIARVNIKDFLPLAEKSRISKAVTGAPSLTFANVGATGDTITRASGSWLTDGFAVGDQITISGTASNNLTAVIAALTATVLTVGAEPLLPETTSAASIVGSSTLTFANVGATGDTITRASGSWLAEGFAVGDTVTISGTASNNLSGVIAALTATVLTFNTEALNAEVIGSHLVTIKKVLSAPAFVSASDAAYSVIDAEPRISIAIGRQRKASYITGAVLRIPNAWAATLREYSADIHIPTYRKADGKLLGCTMLDQDGANAELDERTDGGMLAARFTCARSYANGPIGSFIALDLTRASESSLLSRYHSMAVANRVSAIVEAETELFIGDILQLNANGTLTDRSRADLESRVNTALQSDILTSKLANIPRASAVVWRASKNDLLNVPGATLTGAADLRINGTIEKILTSVRVGGAS